MLRGQNIILRDLEETDFSFLKEIENNHEHWKFGGECKQYSDSELIAYIANSGIDIAVAKQYRFVIDLDSTPIGFIDLFNYTKDSAGIGVIIDENYRMRGFGREALTLLMDYAFSVLLVNRLHALINTSNIPSVKLFKACGFLLDKEKRDTFFFVKYRLHRN